MIKVIAFQREGRLIIGQVYSTFMERQRDGRYMEVFFCQDSDGIRRRVEKPDVLLSGTKLPKSMAKAPKKSKRRREREARRERKANANLCKRPHICTN